MGREDEADRTENKKEKTETNEREVQQAASDQHGRAGFKVEQNYMASLVSAFSAEVQLVQDH